MPKKKKLQLKTLKVQSFVTELGNDANKVKGGVRTDAFIGTCLDCSIGICLTDFGSDCLGTCAGSNCVGTCDSCNTCNTCDTCDTCFTECNCTPVVTIPSCPQIVCTA